MESTSLCKGERSSMDIISTLPEATLETILQLLSTEEAARTSILSREWRYKWTTIPKLYFHLSKVSERMTKVKQAQGKNMDTSSEPFSDLLQILLSHQGPVHEFDLNMHDLKAEKDSFGFDQILLHLSKNHPVKKLTLYGSDGFGWDSSAFYKLPISIFSLHQLTDLDISYLDLDHEPIFSGFGSLRSLSLNHIGISTESLLHLLSNCPSLKKLNLLIGETHHGDRYCTVVELFKCLPTLEHLTIWGEVLQFNWLDLDSVPQELPTLLLQLKYFCFKDMCFVNGSELAFLLVLIKWSPNLEKIKLQIDWNYDGFHEEDNIVWEEYSDVWLEHSNVWLEHLNELEIDSFCYSKLEMKFLMFILARSPKLKTVRLRIVIDWERELDYFGLEEYSVVWIKNSNVWLEHLDELKIDHFSNTKLDMEFLKFILARSPKLKKVSISSVVFRKEKLDHDGSEEYSVVWEENSDVWLEHLNELKLGCFYNTKPEMEFVKFILARSPKLEKVSITSVVNEDQKLKMLEALLRAPRVSPVVIYV